MTDRNRSGATHDGARSQGEAAEGVPAGPDRGLAQAPPDAPAGASGPAAWPGTGATGTPGTAELTGGRTAENGPAGAGRPEYELAENELADAELAEAGPAEAGLAEAGLAEAGLAEAGLAEMDDVADSADLPLWDWSPPGAGSGPEEAGAGSEAAAGAADPPKAEWKLVVTPVGEPAENRGSRVSASAGAT